MTGSIAASAPPLAGPVLRDPQGAGPDDPGERVETPAAALIEPLPALLGDGAVRLTRRLAQGGGATVYEAEVDPARFDLWPRVVAGRPRETTAPRRGPERGARRPGPCVAVKVTPMCASRRFADEWCHLMALDHPNVIRVYAGGVDPRLGVEYYVMELVRGALTFDELAALPVLERLEIIRQAALGLARLHAVGLVHRDVKPGNLLVDRDPTGRLRVRVADLGLAKDIERGLDITRGDALMGTPQFIAPEVLCSPDRATPAADVYSLGASLYALLAGQPPYDGLDLYALLARVVAGRPPVDLQMLRPTLPRALCQLVRRMLAFDPRDRPGSLIRVIESLERLAVQLRTLSGCRTRVLPPARRVQTPAPSPLRRRILLAEPDETVRGPLMAFLVKAGYRIDLAGDGAQALLALGRGEHDLVVAACELPIFDGPGLAAAMRAHGIEIPVLLLGRPAGADAPTLAGVEWLARPISLPRLVSRLELTGAGDAPAR